MSDMGNYNLIIEKDCDGYFFAKVNELPGCYTQAKDIPTLLKRAKEAIELYLSTEDFETTPNKFIGVKKIEI